MMRAHLLICSLLALCMFDVVAARTAAAQAAPAPAAQPPADAPAPPATKPAPEAPATTPTDATTPAPATSPAPDTAGTAPAATSADDLAAAQQREAGRAQLDRERVRIATELAQRKAERQTFFATHPDASEEPPAPARHGDAGAPFAIGASYEQPWYKDAGYNLFSDNDVGHRFGVWLAYDVASLRDDTFLAIEAGFGTENADDSGLLGGALSTELATKTVNAGAQLRWVPVSWLQPHLRLAGGLAFVNMSVDARQHFKDDGTSPFGSLGLGFTLRTPSRMFEDNSGKLAALSVGLMLEGGYTVAAPVDFDFAGPGRSAQAIPIKDAKAGRLDRSGPYARASIVLRF